MKVITFRDYSGREVVVRSDSIEVVIKPHPTRPNDNGSVVLTSGRAHSFEHPNDAQRMIEAMMEDTV